MSQLSHAQFPLRRHPHLLVDHRRAGSASVADSRGADAVRLTGSGGRLHFGMVAGFKSERWPASNRNRWPDCVGIRTEPGVHAAARLYGRKPDAEWRYETADDGTAFYLLRWNEPDGKKVIRPLSWFDG